MTINQVPPDVAIWAADEFINYFENFSSIEDYLRYAKKEVIGKINNFSSIDPDYSLKSEFFNEDIHPEEMDFEIKFVGERFQNGLPQEYYVNLLTATSSAVIEKNIPGRELRWIVFEKNTKKIIGFIRFGSPTINSKPRNLWLGKAPDLSLFNRHACMGFAIVPSQPFGYNFLGGKLLALMCVSHFARETLNKVFEKDIGFFETTSLYGSTTSASQYDGLKPFIRYKGLTDSKFLPLLHNTAFHRLHDEFTKWNNNEPLTENRASSKKMKRQTKMISIIRNSLDDEDKLKKFNEVIEMAFNLTQRKRSYSSDYGYGNVREVLLGEQDTLVPGQNWDKFYLENIISWWKKKAGKRYEKLKKEDRFRDKVELWTEDDDIQIIR
tara:strand:+ start:1857 stop:2999 length:1143 start_codon:yes stop_codon:yes gene_type:complete